MSAATPAAKNVGCLGEGLDEEDEADDDGDECSHGHEDAEVEIDRCSFVSAAGDESAGSPSFFFDLAHGKRVPWIGRRKHGATVKL
jgi:hypothetical protein